MEPTQLAAENTELRRKLEEYRQRELTELRERLAKAESDVTHYRNEAARNAEVGRQIAAEAQQTISELRLHLDSARRAQGASIRPQA